MDYIAALAWQIVLAYWFFPVAVGALVGLASLGWLLWNVYGPHDHG